MDFWNFEIIIEPTFWIGTIIFSFIAYIIGSINAGQILSILGSGDLSKVGSGNFGATNAGRLYGIKGFIFVFLFDMFKAIFAALILTIIITQGTFDYENIDSNYFFAYTSIPISMVFLIIGHSYPIFFGFKGGKGVATSLGCVIIINWIFAIIALLVFGIFIGITRRTSLGSIFGTGIGCLLVVFIHPFFYEATPNLFFVWTYNWTIIISGLFVLFFVIFKHKSNIQEIILGKESWIKNKSKGKIKNEKEG